MKIIVCGNSVTFKSDLTIAEIEKAATYRPESVLLKRYHSPSVTDIGSRQPCVRTSWACCCKMAMASCRVLQQVDVRRGLPVL